MRYCLLLVDGQTEERFVKDVLTPHLQPFDLYAVPTLLITKVVKHGANFKGGVTSFGKFENDLRKLLEGAGPEYLISTILDYYQLPADFPGMNDRPDHGSPEQRVTHVERALQDYFGHPQFFPFLALHEYEAWLFASRDILPAVIPELSQRNAFARLCDANPEPELINEREKYNPAARICQMFPAYRKVLHGPPTAARIGLATIRSRCPHFDRWLTCLEEFGRSGVL